MQDGSARSSTSDGVRLAPPDASPDRVSDGRDLTLADGREAATGGPSGPLDTLLTELHTHLKSVTTGTVATYIPSLAKARPDAFGIAVAALDGFVYAVGDADLPFTIQSVSKPFVYALALADSGLDAVLSKIGVEPTGDAFNSIALDEATGRAMNPMVNAGAIVASSLVSGATRAEQFERILSGLSAFAGRPLTVDEDVFESERETGNRNRAIGHLLRTVGALDADVDAVLDLYFRQCSVLVTATDLALMAATLANGGVNPRSGERVMRTEDVGRVLTVMSTCGMYDFAGQWQYDVGLPAKSGVAGDIAAVLPGQLGIGLYSPPLDERGNTVRGIAVCRELSTRLALHQFRPAGVLNARQPRSYVWDPSRALRLRTARELQVLAASETAIMVHEVQGEQSFATAEALVRRVQDALEGAGWVVLDFRRCGRIDDSAAVVLSGMVDMLVAHDVQVALADPHRLPAVGALAQARDGQVTRHGELDSALEWCEIGALARGGHVVQLPDQLVPLEDQELLRDLDDAQLAVVRSLLTTKVYTPGTIVFDEGDAADGLYFVGAGLVVADIKVAGGRRRSRIGPMGAGQAFGELALLDGGSRSSRVFVEETTLCHVLTRDHFDRLRAEHPDIAAVMLAAMARTLAERLRRATSMVRILQS